MDNRLKDIIGSGGGIVFFGGAGVSTESGIPDFRSKSGLYNAEQKYGRPPEELLSYGFFLRHPDIFFDYYKNNLIHSKASPNAAHKALAKMEEEGLLSAVVTQNIDGLHQKAGSNNVFELHGSVLRNYCMECGRKYNLGYILAYGETIPRCEVCGGMVRPDVVLYGEVLDDMVVSGAAAAIEKADVLIVGGTSLVVYPAAGLIDYFKGDSLVLINKTPTPYDSKADLVIHGSIGRAFADY